MTEGGIFPAILGTFLVTIVTAVLAIPLGMFTAIYLNEYAKQSRSTRIIRLAIRNLSGVPSIVYGLFGVILFVNICEVRDVHPLGRPDPGPDDPALDDHGQRGGPQDHPEFLPRRRPWPSGRPNGSPSGPTSCPTPFRGC